MLARQGGRCCRRGSLVETPEPQHLPLCSDAPRRLVRAVGDGLVPAVVEGLEETVFDFGGDVRVGLLTAVAQDVTQPSGSDPAAVGAAPPSPLSSHRLPGSFSHVPAAATNARLTRMPMPSPRRASTCIPQLMVDPRTCLHGMG